MTRFMRVIHVVLSINAVKTWMARTSPLLSG